MPRLSNQTDGHTDLNADNPLRLPSGRVWLPGMAPTMRKSFYRSPCRISLTVRFGPEGAQYPYPAPDA